MPKLRARKDIVPTEPKEPAFRRRSEKNIGVIPTLLTDLMVYKCKWGQA